MTKLETIPAEEGATLLPQKPKTGIRRVVAVSAMASFVIGVLAATAVRRTPVRHASNLHSKHKYETTEVDDEGPHPYYWDDDDFPDDGVETEACERSGRSSTSAACARTGATTPTWSATAHRGPINRSRSRPPTSA